MATNSALSRSLGEFLTGRVIVAKPRRNPGTPVSTGGVPKSCTPAAVLETPNDGSRPFAGRCGIVKQSLSRCRGVEIGDGQSERMKVIGRPRAPIQVAG